MKKFLLALGCILLTGCSFEYDFSDKYLYTTAYPIEYAASSLYADHATVASVYPMGSDKTYEVTEKKKDIYAEGETFIYNTKDTEQQIVKISGENKTNLFSFLNPNFINFFKLRKGA